MYFVILNYQKNGIYLPMIDDDENLAMFESEIEATVAGNKNPFGSEFGFEVFELGNDKTGFIVSQSVEANLLCAILEKLEEIRCGIIDVEGLNIFDLNDR